MSDIPFGDFIPDQPALTLQNGLKVVLNIVPTDVGYRPANSPVTQGAQLDEYCRGASSIRYYDGATRTFAGDRTKLYIITADAATDASRALGYDLGSSPDPFWDFVTYGEEMIAFNLAYEAQQISKGQTQFSNLVEAPKASFAAAIGLQESFLAVAHIDRSGTVRPNVVAWNDPGDLTQWTPGVGFAGEQALEGDGGPIISMLGGDFGVIFQDTAIWVFEYVGLPTTFAFRQVANDHGLLARRAAVIAKNNIYYLSRQGFQMIDRTLEGGITPIGAGQVDLYFQNEVDTARITEVQAIGSLANDSVLFAFPSRSAPPGTLDRVLVYNTLTRKWGLIAYEFEFFFNGYTQTVLSDDLDENSDTGINAGTSMDSPTFVESERFLMGFNSEHRLLHFVGSPLPATFSTGLMSFGDDTYEMVNKFRPLIEGAGRVQGFMGITDDPNRPPRQLPVRDLSRYGYFEYRTARPRPRARYFTFGLAVEGGWDSMVGINIPDREISQAGEHD